MKKNYNIKFYTPKEFAEIIGVSIPTLRNWDKNEKLIAFRFPSGKLYYTSEHFRKLNSIKQGVNK